MTDTGHVFVVRGRIEHLDCDAILLPTDDAFSVTRRWAGALGLAGDAEPRNDRAWRRATTALRPRRWSTQRWGRAADEKKLAGPTWFVDAARYGADARADLARVLERLERALRDIARARLDQGSGRPRPLVAVPTLGVGEGGFGDVRGDVIDGLLRTCAAVVAKEAIDVVIVAFAASDHAAFQARRRELGSGHDAHLDAALLDAARAVAGRVREGSLALFLGAGVSMSAGLPSWDTLLERIAADAKIELPAKDGLGALDRAELLKVELGERLGEHVARHTTGSGRYGLNHALLASFGCEQAVTTNYDQLYEAAARDGDARVLRALPIDSVLPRAPWLLKMHGDVAHPETIVLTRSDFVGYDAVSRPMGSVVQALLLTKHLLVVGASLTDDNFLRLAHEVLAFQARGSTGPSVLGTVVSMKPDQVKERLWKDRFTFVATSPEGVADDGTLARRLAIFLDAVAMHAAPTAHLADERYAFLLAEADRPIAERTRELAALIRARGTGDDGPWAAVLAALEEAGARERHV